jgi:hypothetical protein
MNVTNGAGAGYLPVADSYDAEDLYQVWQTPYARGSLEQLTDTVEQGLRELLREEDRADTERKETA